MERAAKGEKGEGCRRLFVSRFSAWAPGLSGPEDWEEWALDRRKIPQAVDAPALEYAPPLFRRRLSQISRMTIQVLHDLLPLGESAKVVFLSFRGEIARQLEINRMLIQEGDLTPAAFSLSVFNTPPALASIALGLTAGYSALYPGQNRFDQGFLAAAAPVLCGAEEETVFVYADELCPPEYGCLCPPGNEPLAFAALLSLQDKGGSVPVFRPGAAPELLENPDVPEHLESPGAFLKHLYRAGGRS
jgi:hypothetical protein